MTTAPKNTTTYATQFAAILHLDQKYGNLPYMVHLMDVLNRVAKITSDSDIRIAAILHDILEDTPATPEHLREVFGDVVCDIVNLVTKDESLSYEENIQRIVDSGNIGAIIVKYGDNRANGSGDKSHMTEARRNKLEARYQGARKVLEQALHDHNIKFS